MEGSLQIHNLLKEIEKTEYSPISDVMQNAIITNGIETVAFNSTIGIGLQNNFSHEIKTGKITSQEKSGRCWMFAGLNLFRATAKEKLNLDDFEFSQNFPMFYDKLEKANYFLESVLRTLKEDIYSRIIMHLMKDPLQDGGQWDMFVSLVEKYGAVPKPMMPETFHSNNSAVMNQLLTSKLREWAAELRESYVQGKEIAELRQMKEEYLTVFFKLLTYFLGDPPTKFSYEFYDKDGKHKCIDNLDPKKFFREYVQVDLTDYVSLIHAPTPDKPFGKTYSVDFLGNVWGGRPVKYLNVDLGALKNATIAQIQAGEPVWFGCDVRLQTQKKKGFMDPGVFLFDHALSTSFKLDKTQRLLYGDSLLTHAMVFTGVHLKNEEAQRWKVENSWGEDRGEKGFFIMSDSWFDEYNYQVVIHKKFLTSELMEQFAQNPVMLPPWDPMGSLAMPR